MHTKGQWKVNKNIGKKGEIGVVADNAPCIIAIMGNQKEWPVEAEANARLIASVPDLLAAAENFFEWHANNFEDFSLQINQQLLCLSNDFGAAIAKAKGCE